MRFRTLALSALLLAALAAYLALGLSRITLDVDITRLLPPGLKETTGYRLFLKNFSRPEELIVTLQGPTPEAVEQAAIALGPALKNGPQPLAKRVIWRSPFDPAASAPAPDVSDTPNDPNEPDTPDASGQTSPELLDFLAWALLNQPPEKMAALEQRLAPEHLDATLAEALEKLATSLDGMDNLLGYDPLGLMGELLGGGTRDLAPDFASKAGTFRLLYVEAAEKLPNYRVMTEWLAQVRAAANGVAQPLGVTVRFTGEPAFVSEISNSMEHDMRLSGMLALGLICLITWIGYRRLRLLPALAGMIVLIFLLTLATCGLLLGSLTVLSVGFGSILIGLTVDYGILIYAARASGAAERSELMRRARRGVMWAAATTAAAFSALIPCGMPGLAELGLLVAVGVAIGLLAFLFIFPRILPWLRLEDAPQMAPAARSVKIPTAVPIAVLGLLLFSISGVLVKGLPKIELDGSSLRPRSSEAYDTLDLLTRHFGGGQQTLSVLVTGRDEAEVAARLAELDTRLAKMKQDGTLLSYALPRSLWPDPATQHANLSGPATRLAAAANRLEAGVLAAGFTEEAFGLSQEVFARWEKWASHAQPSPFWPEADAARWLLQRFAVSPSNSPDPAHRSLCLGIIKPKDPANLDALEPLQTEGVYLAGSRLVGRVMERFLHGNFKWLAALFVTITCTIIAFAVRDRRVFLLTLGRLALGFSALIGAMSWLGLGWNSFTLPALLLSLGTGCDYFIYVILELQEHGSLDKMRARLMRPLLVCAGNSIIGFGSLAWAGNLGLSSLGRVCALALTFNVLIALFFMPWVWKNTRRAQPATH